MENAFEADFSAVKLHSGSEASRLNRYMGAKAFTVGADVFLRDGMPDTASDGESLLAHELAHTVQQGASAPLAARKVQRGEEDEEEEKE
jgi:hypothetical protein